MQHKRSLTIGQIQTLDAIADGGGYGVILSDIRGDSFRNAMELLPENLRRDLSKLLELKLVDARFHQRLYWSITESGEAFLDTYHTLADLIGNK